MRQMMGYGVVGVARLGVKKGNRTMIELKTKVISLRMTVVDIF